MAASRASQRPLPFQQLVVELHPRLLAPSDQRKHALLLTELRACGYDLFFTAGGLKHWTSRLPAALWGCFDVATAEEYSFARSRPGRAC